MQVKCPNCRSEIYFTPPTNLKALPLDYSHRIKCPTCGTTINVNLRECALTKNKNATTSNTNTKHSANEEAQEAYDRYVGLLSQKLKHGTSTKRNLALTLKSIIITLIVASAALIAIGIAFFVLYELNGDKITLSSSMENTVRWFGIYGAAGFVAGLLFIWLNSCVYVEKKDKVVDSEVLADAKREFEHYANLAGGVSKFKNPKQAAVEKNNAEYAQRREYEAKYGKSNTVTTYRSGIPQNKNFLERLVDKATAWSDKQAYGEIMKNSSGSKYCGRCHYYMPTDSQGYMPGQCAKHSRTVCWGDGACDDFE